MKISIRKKIRQLRNLLQYKNTPEKELEEIVRVKIQKEMEKRQAEFEKKVMDVLKKYVEVKLKAEIIIKKGDRNGNGN